MALSKSQTTGSNTSSRNWQSTTWSVEGLLPRGRPTIPSAVQMRSSTPPLRRKRNGSNSAKPSLLAYLWQPRRHPKQTLHRPRRLPLTHQPLRRMRPLRRMSRNRLGDSADMNSSHQPVFHLTLKPTGSNWRTPPVQRLRAALKRLLRNYGLRCTSAFESEEGSQHTSILPTERGPLLEVLARTRMPSGDTPASTAPSHNERN